MHVLDRGYILIRSCKHVLLESLSLRVYIYNVGMMSQSLLRAPSQCCSPLLIIAAVTPPPRPPPTVTIASGPLFLATSIPAVLGIGIASSEASRCPFSWIFGSMV